MGSPEEEKGQGLGAASPLEGVTPTAESHADLHHEHLHEHVHHGGAAANHANHPHEVVYADMTQQSRAQSFEKGMDKNSLGTDEEMGNVDASRDANDPASPTGFLKKWYRILRLPIHIFIWLVFTA